MRKNRFRSENIARHKLKKLSIFPVSRIIPSVITIAALCLGLTSVKLCMIGRLDLTMLCILLASLCDAMDGRIARYLGCSSQFGAELDSLSDLVCFGVCPALIMYITSLKFIGNIGWAASLYFTVCCALRLARFNVDQINGAYTDGGEKVPDNLKMFFIGIPAPAGAIVCLLPIMVFLQTGCLCCISPIICVSIMFLSGSLMVSRVRTFSSKMIKFDKKYMVLTLLGFSIIVIFMIVEIWITILSLTILYVILIPFGEIAYKKEIEKNKIITAQINCDE